MFHDICHCLCLHGPVFSITASCYLPLLPSCLIPPSSFAHPSGVLSQHHLYCEVFLVSSHLEAQTDPTLLSPGPLCFWLYWKASHLSVCLSPGIPNFFVCSVVSPGIMVEEVLKKHKTNSWVISWTMYLRGFGSLSTHFEVFLLSLGLQHYLVRTSEFIFKSRAVLEALVSLWQNARETWQGRKDFCCFMILVAIYQGRGGRGQWLSLWILNHRLFILWPTGSREGDLLPSTRPYLQKCPQPPPLGNKLSKQEQVGNTLVQTKQCSFQEVTLIPVLWANSSFQRRLIFRGTSRAPPSPWDSTSSILSLPRAAPFYYS